MIVADLFAKLGLKVDKKSFSAADRLLKGVKQAAVALGVIQGARFLKTLITDTVELGDNIAKMAEQLGMTTDAFQEWEFIAAKSDLEVGELVQGLKFLGKNALDAATGGKEMRKNFRSLGIKNVKNQNGQLKTSNELLLELAENWHKIPKAQRAAAAMKVLGKQGATFVPLLNKGPEAIRAMREEAQKHIIPPEEIERLAEADDKFKDLKFALRRIAALFATKVLPVITKVVDLLTGWILENKELISEVFDKIVEHYKIFAKIAYDGIQKIIQAFQYLESEGADFKTVLVAIYEVSKFVFKALFDAITYAIVMVGKLGEWLGTAAAAVVVLFTNMAEAIKSGFEAAVNWVSEKLEAFFSWIEDKINKILDRFRDLRDAPGAFLDFITGDVESEAVVNSRKRDAAKAALRPIAPTYNKPANSAANNNFNAQISVTAPPGSTPEQLRPVLAGAMQDFWDAKMREGAAATGQ